MKTKRFKANFGRGLVAAAVASVLVACGGGGGGSSDTAETSTSVVTRGVITQLGSIWVNGVEYETPNGGSYKDDDSTSSSADYKVGQVVRLRGTRNANGISGTATDVDYEAEIEGAATGGAINGVTVLITPSTNTDDATLNSGALIDNNRYEVSGLWVGDDTLEATYIKDDDDGDGEDEIKGYVENAIANVSFDIHGITYNFAGPPAVANGDYVEVHFDPTSCAGAPLTCTATEVELEDEYDDYSDGQEVEFEGVVNMDPTDVNACPGSDADFLIDSICIDWDSVSEWDDGLTGDADMASGLRVEVEGYYVGDILVADEIKGRGNRVEILSKVSSTSGADFDVMFGAITVTTNGNTQIDPAVNPITAGQGLKVEGIRTGLNTVMAIQIEAETVDDDAHKVRAEVDENGADPGTNTITVMGISSLADANTELEVDDVLVAPGNGLTTETDIDGFLGQIDDDNIISLTNGPRDIVEVQIDTTNGGNGSLGNPYGANEIEIEEEDD